MPVLLFCVYLGMQWWANWYPSNEPGGGGYIAQRLFATKNERHAVLAGLWFNLANYAIRPWPWILAGLCGIVLYGGPLRQSPASAPDSKLNYIQLMIDHLPGGWRGLLLAAFAAAYMSTISTQLNWGASYLINDLYRPFLRRRAKAGHDVAASRLMTLVILGLSVAITFLLESIKGAWEFLLALGAGTGLVLILRWYWWRINAWSEIVSMGTALIVSVILMFTPLGGEGAENLALRMLITLGFTTAAWLAVTFLTPPEDPATLRSFCDRVRPPGPGWRRVDPSAPPIEFGLRFLAWASALALIYSLLFGTGHFLFGHAPEAWTCVAVATAAGVSLAVVLRHPAFHDRPVPAADRNPGSVD
jgi:Na+/proline symporter